MADIWGESVFTALQQYNNNFGTSWDLGANWSNVGTQFETFVNKYLFPKLNETTLININLGNRFDFLAKEDENIGQYSEEYVFLDSIPVNMNLSKREELMLKRNYPQMATKIYSAGIEKKLKFTLNDNDLRLNFITLGDAVSYALGVYRKKLSDINVSEEQEIKAMLVDYALNQTTDKRDVSTVDELFDAISQAILNLQNNSAKYNEATKASGGTIGRHTTTTKLKDIVILTNDTVKTKLLNSHLANTYHNNGIDFTKKIISFDDLGGVYEVLEDVEITSPTTIAFLRSFGDYQSEIGDIFPKHTILTFDITELEEFETEGLVKEIKPETDIFAFIFDIKKLRYKRNSKNLLSDPFINPEFGEVTYWLKYFSRKNMSPFYNSVVIKG